MDWVAGRPTEVGWYWVWKPGLIYDPRLIHVWRYPNGPGTLFTNEDGGAAIEDEMYDGCYSLGPIVAPPKPSLP